MAVKFTRKVKRGLVLMHGLMIDTLGDGPIAQFTVSKWPRPMQHDFNAAMAWLESIEAATEPKPDQQVFDMLAGAIGQRAENDPRAGAA